MSRYGFYHVLNRPHEHQEEMTDLLGYDIYDWLSVGAFGFDEELETYFFNLEGSWVFGTAPEEITSIAEFQGILSRLFGGALLPFNEDGLTKVAECVEDALGVLSPEEAALMSVGVPAEYLEERVRVAQAFRNEG
ncbi:MAG: hypothetical protein ABN479_12090 [Billgrantia sp.]|uniref:Uncharacterized protein n=1 Tax=Billgrantia desiderata TaxID=52021 RepID=A0ABS9B9Y2_9GAMM|nr:hypothetical protein [Halomonas desiderata]MCE8044378.1 hypothetical protein [Halomonas desiderata]MCE8048952.1 hypothetical protein [Halomonas desiderata]